MIFIVRTIDPPPTVEDVRVVRARLTPSPSQKAETRDLFCVGDEQALDKLRGAGLQIVLLHDGWYADDHGGGIAVWGNGRYWEVRESPFDVIEQG
jgi:hypothetical protein